MQCIVGSYGDERPAELQSDEFLMRFIEVWMRQSRGGSGDAAANWQNRAASSTSMFQNEILNLIHEICFDEILNSSDDLVTRHLERRQHLLLEAVGYASTNEKLPDDELVFLLQAMFDMGMLAESIIFKWASDERDSTEEKKRVAAALRKIAEDV